MEHKRILISGGGIAGLTLADWLHRHGLRPTVLEAAPALRGGGSMIDFWGLGYDVAERMGILEDLGREHHEIPALECVDYFDAVSQVHVPAWSQGRVALCGDACQCVSLIAGQGAALAMAGAYILAGELKRIGDHRQALRRYQELLAPEIARKQAMAQRFAASFVPSSRFGIVVQDSFIRLMFLPLLSRHLIPRFPKDDLRLEAY